MKQVEKLIGYFKEFQLTDILAFGNILQVQETDDFSDYVTEICLAFEGKGLNKRRQLLKLAKDVVQANQELKEQEEKA